MYYVVTGAAGFIGSNLLRALNERGETDIIAVDNLKNAHKFSNLVDCEIADYIDKDAFLAQLAAGAFDGAISAVLHQGACSDTMETDGRYMMDNNYRYSLELLDYCQEEEVPLIYASSGAVYGGSQSFRESRECEAPLNIYGYSKFLFDQVVRRRFDERSAQIVGLRYFNVYGPRESHKKHMASVAFHCFTQYQSEGKVRLFEGSGGYPHGEQRRDFISVEDVIKVNLYFLGHDSKSGIFNVGTGYSQSFNDVALATINACRRAKGQPDLSLAEMQRQGLIQYIPFPDGLKRQYQSYTQAEIGALREAGYGEAFLNVERGVSSYVDTLLKKSS